MVKRSKLLRAKILPATTVRRKATRAQNAQSFFVNTNLAEQLKKLEQVKDLQSRIDQLCKYTNFLQLHKMTTIFLETASLKIKRDDFNQAWESREINVISSIYFNFICLGKKYIKQYNLTTPQCTY